MDECNNSFVHLCIKYKKWFLLYRWLDKLVKKYKKKQMPVPARIVRVHKKLGDYIYKYVKGYSQVERYAIIQLFELCGKPIAKILQINLPSTFSSQVDCDVKPQPRTSLRELPRALFELFAPFIVKKRAPIKSNKQKAVSIIYSPLFDVVLEDIAVIITAAATKHQKYIASFRKLPTAHVISEVPVSYTLCSNDYQNKRVLANIIKTLKLTNFKLTSIYKPLQLINKDLKEKSIRRGKVVMLILAVAWSEHFAPVSILVPVFSPTLIYDEKEQMRITEYRGAQIKSKSLYSMKDDLFASELYNALVNNIIYELALSGSDMCINILAINVATWFIAPEHEYIYTLSNSLVTQLVDEILKLWRN